MQTKNATIESVTITNEDHGVLSAWVNLDYGGSCQGFGGYALYVPKNPKHSTNSRNYAGHFIWRVMEVAGVSKWEHLSGKTIRVISAHDHIESIGHITKDIWFSPREEFRQMEEANVQ